MFAFSVNARVFRWWKIWSQMKKNMSCRFCDLAILRRQLRNPHLFQNCGTSNTNQNKKCHNFKRNEDHATVFLKWTDFKSTKKCIFVCFWADVGQPHDHLGWATSMPFAQYWELLILKNSVFFESVVFLLHPHENQSQIMC